jgi:hypothetical protein
MHRGGKTQYFLYVQCSIASMFDSFNECAPKKAITRGGKQGRHKTEDSFQKSPYASHSFHFYISMMDLFHEELGSGDIRTPHSLRYDIRGSDIRHSPIFFITDIGQSASG